MIEVFLYRSPVGPLDVHIVGSGAVAALYFDGQSERAFPGDHPVSEALDEYFESGIGLERLHVCSAAAPFRRSVLDYVRTIPPGEVRTYAEVAAAAGKTGAARAVGNAMSSNLTPIIVPCHRVVSSSGLGGYSGGLERKKFLLALEERLARLGRPGQFSPGVAI